MNPPRPARTAPSSSVMCAPPRHTPRSRDPAPSPPSLARGAGERSIVGTDVNEVGSSALPGLPQEPRPSLCASSVSAPTAPRAKKTRGLDDDGDRLTNALKTAAKPRRRRRYRVQGERCGLLEFADLPTDPLERGLALVRKGVEAMRTGGVDPKEALLKFAKKPKSGPNVREAASTVVNRLLETLEAAADDKSDTSRELDYSGGSDDENNESKDVEAVDGRGGGGDDSEDVFATATNSPVKPLVVQATARASPPMTLSALQGMTVTVEEA